MDIETDLQLQCAAIHSMIEALLPVGVLEGISSGDVWAGEEPGSSLIERFFLFALPGAAVCAFIVLTISRGVAFLPQEFPGSHKAAPAAPASNLFLKTSSGTQIIVPHSRRNILLPPQNPRAASGSTTTGTTLSPEQLREEVRKNGGKGALEIMKSVPHSPLVHEAPGVRATAVIGTYLTAGSVGRAAFLRQTIIDTKASGGDALVLEVKGGNVHFAASAPLAEKIGTIQPQFDLPVVIQQAHDEGMYVIARFVSVKDPLFAERVPAAQIKNPKTGRSVGDVWVDPSAPETLEYNSQILISLLKSGIDEVNFDYIRYPTEYAMSDIGLTATEKEDHLEAFLRMARQMVDTYSPGTKIGISTYAILGWDFDINNAALGQNFIRFAPLLDVISPMAYPSSFTSPEYYNPAKNSRSRAYTLVYHTLQGYRKLLGDEQAKKLRPWIQAYYMDGSQIRDEIDAVYDSGLCGFTFWNANNNYGPAYAGLSMSRGDRPTLCKE
jgi:hypothetical protein